MRGWVIAGWLYGALGVALGAFGAHALRGVLDAAALSTWHTAVEYQLWHALALILVSAALRESRWQRISMLAFIAGIALFSGSLYALALGAPRWLGAVTPLGGLSLIAGWLAAAAASRARPV